MSPCAVTPSGVTSASQMALLELGGKKFTIPVGEVALGSDASCAISLSGSGILPRHAVLQGQADGQVNIRKASPAADVLINGVRLGAEPTPLLHGDKVEVGGHELTFVDERRSGSTQYVQALPQKEGDRKSTRLNSSHLVISYAVFCLKKKKKTYKTNAHNQRLGHTTQPTKSLPILSYDAYSPYEQTMIYHFTLLLSLQSSVSVLSTDI